MTVLGPEGRRQMPLTDLFVAPRKTSLDADELLVEIVIPKPNLGKPAAFEKFGLRKGQALALVNAAASLWVDRDKAVFVAPRIALGAVAPTVIRARAGGSLSRRPRRHRSRRWPRPAGSPPPRRSRSAISAPARTTGATSSRCW